MSRCAPAWPSPKTARLAPGWESTWPISTTPALTGIVITNFDNEMIALYRQSGGGTYADVALASGVGKASRNSLGFGCMFFDADLDGRLDLLAVNGHIDETVRNIRSNVGYAQAPQLLLNQGKVGFRDVAAEVGRDFAAPKVGRGAACGDFDRDGDVDILITTNQGPALLHRNDVTSGNRSIRVRLIGTKSNRDAIGAVVRMSTPEGTQSRMVKTGSSYLCQSELAVTFGLGKRTNADRLIVEWPSGLVEDYKNLAAGSYVCQETRGIQASTRY
jgi:hypothetical protein